MQERRAARKYVSRTLEQMCATSQRSDTATTRACTSSCGPYSERPRGEAEKGEKRDAELEEEEEEDAESEGDEEEDEASGLPLARRPQRC